MSRKLNTVVAILLLGIFPVLSIYAGAPGVIYTEDKCIEEAIRFLKGSPTYSYDGMEETIEFIGIEPARSPYTWFVTLRFTSRNGGYGDRTDQMTLTMLTEHTMIVLISKGKVVSAVTDDIFNEITGEIIDMPKSPLLEAEELVMEWLRNAQTFNFDGIEGTMRVVNSVILESYPEQYVITVAFECSHPGYGDRSDMILAQVITEHTAIVIVSSGEVQSAVIDGQWDELNQREKGISELLPPEEVVNIVIEYLRDNYSEANTLNLNDDWTITETTPEGLLGQSIIEYTGDNWKIVVSHPVVWKPTYTVEVEQADSGFVWKGTIDQSGSITELTE
ncbi:hypothetical protein GF319_12435 [Candidatus Bathyarchaeota archaeon]|jgi:hypothetical protein|nr:hypothetical protein [Candidatus Bathyarchaeota archaeon]